jgi:hypothetical protein
MANKQVSFAVQSLTDVVISIGNQSFNGETVQQLVTNDPNTYFLRKTVVVDESTGLLDGCATDLCMEIDENISSVQGVFGNSTGEYELETNDFVEYAERNIGQTGWNILAGPDPKHRPK